MGQQICKRCKKAFAIDEKGFCAPCLHEVEFEELIEELWNRLARQVPYMREVQTDKFSKWLWKRLYMYTTKTIKQAMEREAEEKRPDIRRLSEHCARIEPQSAKPHEACRQDVSGVVNWDFKNDCSPFAQHVCDSAHDALLDPAWYEQAARLIEQGQVTRRWGPDGQAYDYSRHIGAYQRMREIQAAINAQTAQERLPGIALAVTFALDRESAIEDLAEREGLMVGEVKRYIEIEKRRGRGGVEALVKSA